MAYLERRAVHMEPRTWTSQTCFVSLLGFVSFSTYFPHSQSIATGDFVGRAAHVVNWMRDGKLGGDGAGAALLRGARCGQASVTWRV